ncbi:hypothetical protein P9D43_20970 [Neobacillus niacini]|uniref:hypothetical protein n=1 Tax=Neobacillus niacini TaxID=86668 RepID=UPI0007AB75F6|nr:hypothetical protein [Neobacillus niacini]MEC1524479.1 hypothetical protein [Neobacillus niacini]
MEKHKITESFYWVKTRDKIGGTIRTNVYKQDNGIFEAYSYYWQDEDEAIVGFSESYDDEQAIKWSRKELRKEWKSEKLLT